MNPLPFEKLKLTCVTSDDADACRCPSEWRSYHMQNVVTFHLMCPTRGEAEYIANAMKTQPKQFKSAFEMHLKRRQTGRQEIAISTENVFNGNLFSKLDQKLPNKNEMLLTVNDANTLLSEAASNAVIQDAPDGRAHDDDELLEVSL